MVAWYESALAGDAMNTSENSARVENRRLIMVVSVG
jgi:hypothetical protein